MPTVPTPHDHALPAETLSEKDARLTTAAEPAYAALGPLRDVIARTMRNTPVRLGPGGTDALADELTLAVAIYTAREVLPPGLLDPDSAITSQWEVQTPFKGRWLRWSQPHDNLDEAREELAYMESRRTAAVRLMRVTTIRTVEPAAPEQCDVDFVGGGRCSKPAGHRPAGSDDPHTP